MSGSISCRRRSPSGCRNRRIEKTPESYAEKRRFASHSSCCTTAGYFKDDRRRTKSDCLARAIAVMGKKRSLTVSDLIDMILSNTLYLLATVCIAGAAIYCGLKKMTKLFVISCIVLIAFLSYVYYTGESVEDTVDKAGDVVK